MVANIIEKQVTNDIFHIINGLCRSGKRNRDKKKLNTLYFVDNAKKPEGTFRNIFLENDDLSPVGRDFFTPRRLTCAACVRVRVRVSNREKSETVKHLILRPLIKRFRSKWPFFQETDDNKPKKKQTKRQRCI